MFEINEMFRDGLHHCEPTGLVYLNHLRRLSAPEDVNRNFKALRRNIFSINHTIHVLN
jgi:hypothetical protein